MWLPGTFRLLFHIEYFSICVLAVNLEQSVGRFAVNLFQGIQPRNGTSYILSPISVHADLCMALLGAKGTTAHQLQSGLQFGSDTRQQIATAYHHFLQPLQQSKSALRVVNKIYVNQEFKVQPNYNQLVADNFFATAESLDFEQPAIAARTINSYVSSRTNNLIKDLVSPASLSSDTRIVLINAVYFKANWAHPFKVRNTRKEEFHLQSDSAAPILLDFMHTTERLRYAELPKLNAILVGLPYTAGGFVLNVLLPKDGLGQLLRRLHGYDLSTLSTGAKMRLIALSFPKFKSRYRVSLLSALKKLGIWDAFSSRADFGDLLEKVNNVAISDVVHEAHINLDENGTEAAAATAVIIAARNAGVSHPSEEVLLVQVNRPFAYYIEDSNHNVIFYGQYCGN